MTKNVFYPISSGSCGNAVFIGCGGVGFLVDCGVSGITVERALRKIGVDPKILSFILVTHAHYDHTSGIGVMSRRYHIPIYASTETCDSIRSDERLGRIAPEFLVPFSRDPDVNGHSAEISIRAFSTSHDARGSVGYRVDFNGRSAAVATDLGFVSQEVKAELKGTDLVLLESNHDRDMLLNGCYPAELKRRVDGNYGHLSNEAAGRFAAELVRGGTKQIFLGHLSEENNTPELAMDTVARELKRAGFDPSRDVRLLLARRGVPSESVRW